VPLWEREYAQRKPPMSRTAAPWFMTAKQQVFSRNPANLPGDWYLAKKSCV